MHFPPDIPASRMYWGISSGESVKDVQMHSNIIGQLTSSLSRPSFTHQDGHGVSLQLTNDLSLSFNRAIPFMSEQEPKPETYPE